MLDGGDGGVHPLFIGHAMFRPGLARPPSTLCHLCHPPTPNEKASRGRVRGVPNEPVHVSLNAIRLKIPSPAFPILFFLPTSRTCLPAVEIQPHGHTSPLHRKAKTSSAALVKASSQHRACLYQAPSRASSLQSHFGNNPKHG